jgi:hypothetical protein
MAHAHIERLNKRLADLKTEHGSTEAALAAVLGEMTPAQKTRFLAEATPGIGSAIYKALTTGSARVGVGALPGDKDDIAALMPRVLFTDLGDEIEKTREGEKAAEIKKAAEADAEKPTVQDAIAHALGRAEG